MEFDSYFLSGKLTELLVVTATDFWKARNGAFYLFIYF